MNIPFVKYQALGNSFLVLDQLVSQGKQKKYERLAKRICEPVYGVGANGLMVVSHRGKKFRADIYNADGSWAEKSGNGLRIAAMHLYNKGKFKKQIVELETGSGCCQVYFHSGNQYRRIISASLGHPIFEASKIPVKSRYQTYINQPIKVASKVYRASAVAIGNPHIILFSKNYAFDWQGIGRELEVHKSFPNRINVGFVIVRGKKIIEVRDWERGAGPTCSSGTGAAAAVAITVMRGYTQRRVSVNTLAGALEVRWDKKSDEMIIKGPVEYVCSGNFRY